MSRCYQCPRKCGADRENTTGFCGVQGLKAARAALHFGEEPCISGTRGSGTVFFSGCVLRCVFCQNAPLSHGTEGKEITPARLGEIFLELQEKGAHNINLVTPTQFSNEIAAVLEKVKPRLDIPVVWNCGGYESTDTIKRLDGLVDVYLPDFKYADGALSGKYSAAPDYPETAIAAIKAMHDSRGGVRFDSDGMMTNGVMVRHLVLPNYRRDSMRALDMLAEALPISEIRLSLMRQYVPCHKAMEIKELARKVTTFEYEAVAEHAAQLGFIGYTQEKASAGTELIPEWNYEGL
ncbi:MAG: radical SAM protein [Eubacterium sp.]|nr:radical SAM protein [Eubacterium sp.]